MCWNHCSVEDLPVVRVSVCPIPFFLPFSVKHKGKLRDLSCVMLRHDLSGLLDDSSYLISHKISNKKYVYVTWLTTAFTLCVCQQCFFLIFFWSSDLHIVLQLTQTSLKFSCQQHSFIHVYFTLGVSKRKKN